MIRRNNGDVQLESSFPTELTYNNNINVIKRLGDTQYDAV